MPVAVVTDTTHYMPREIVEAHGIQLVSLYVNWGDRQEREGDMDSFDAFYDQLMAARELPTTSQPSVGDFLAVYEPIVARGDDIVSVHLAGGISGTVASAGQARDVLVGRGVAEGRIVVVDSRQGCAGHGVQAIAAAAAAASGAGAAEAAEAARRCGADMQIFFAVDTLEYLRRGGRIGAASAYLGTALKIKPILTFDDRIVPVERVRTAGRAFERLVRHLEERRAEGCDAWFIQHVRAHDRAERMHARGREIFGVEPEFVSEIGPVIGTHVGPGLLGVAATHRASLEAAATISPTA